jgi:hypothetical protein
MNAVLYESIGYDFPFLLSVFSIRDVPIIYHPMLLKKADYRQQ